MQLHLVLPGLLWPGKALRDTAFDLDLPALAWLLGRGRQAWGPPLPLEHWLCRAFRMEPREPPLAALRLLGEGQDPGEAHWLCADPARLRIEQRRLALDVGKAGDSGLTTTEMQQIAAALAPLLAEVGEYQAGAPGHGYLKLRAPARLLTCRPRPPPTAAILAGRGGCGAVAASWQRGANAVAYLAAECATRGKDAPLNSLWFWAPAGCRRVPPERQRLPGGERSHPLLSGLAAWSGIAHHASQQPDARSSRPGNSLLLLDSLQSSVRQLDALAWRAALADIERDWLQPLRQHLRAGRIDSLRLTALGDEACLDLG